LIFFYDGITPKKDKFYTITPNTGPKRVSSATFPSLEPPTTDDSQKWNFVWVKFEFEHQWYQITNKKTGKVISATNMDDTAPLQLADVDTSNTNQLWAFEAASLDQSSLNIVAYRNSEMGFKVDSNLSSPKIFLSKISAYSDYSQFKLFESS